MHSFFITTFGILSFLAKIDHAKFLLIASKFLIFISALSLVAYWINLRVFLVFGSAIGIGMVFSIYYPYLMSLPSKYNMIISEKVTSNIVITFAIGEGVAAAFVGYLMELIHPIMLFIFIFMVSIWMFYLVKKLIDRLENLQEEKPLLLT